MGVFDIFHHDNKEGQTKTEIVWSGPWLHNWRVIEGVLHFEEYCGHCKKFASVPCLINCSFIVGYAGSHDKYVKHTFEAGKLTKSQTLPEDIGFDLYDGYEGILGIEQTDGTPGRYWTPICPHCGKDITGN